MYGAETRTERAGEVRLAATHVHMHVLKACKGLRYLLHDLLRRICLARTGASEVGGGAFR